MILISEQVSKPPLVGIDFEKITFKRDHIQLNQFIQIHRYIVKNTFVTTDEFKEERRKAMDDKDDEEYKYFVLSQLA